MFELLPVWSTFWLHATYTGMLLKLDWFDAIHTNIWWLYSPQLCIDTCTTKLGTCPCPLGRGICIFEFGTFFFFPTFGMSCCQHWFKFCIKLQWKQAFIRRRRTSSKRIDLPFLSTERIIPSLRLLKCHMWYWNLSYDQRTSLKWPCLTATICHNESHFSNHLPPATVADLHQKKKK